MTFLVYILFLLAAGITLRADVLRRRLSFRALPVGICLLRLM